MRVVGCALLLISVLSCASSQDAVINPAASLPAGPLTAFVEKHGDKSADVDAHVERALIANGIGVTEDKSASTLTVKYADDWKWDLVMYLRALDLQIYDARTGTLIGSARYSNAAFTHSYPNTGKIAEELVAQVLTKLKRPRVH